MEAHWLTCGFILRESPLWWVAACWRLLSLAAIAVLMLARGAGCGVGLRFQGAQRVGGRRVGGCGRGGEDQSGGDFGGLVVGDGKHAGVGASGQHDAGVAELS